MADLVHQPKLMIHRRVASYAIRRADPQMQKRRDDAGDLASVAVCMRRHDSTFPGDVKAMHEIDLAQAAKRRFQPFNGRHADGHARQPARLVIGQGRQEHHRLSPQQQPSAPAGHRSHGKPYNPDGTLHRVRGCGRTVPEVCLRGRRARDHGDSNACGRQTTGQRGDVAFASTR